MASKLSDDDARKFLAVLEPLISSSNSLTEAVTAAFVELREQDPNWTHGVRALQGHLREINYEAPDASAFKGVNSAKREHTIYAAPSQRFYEKEAFNKFVSAVAKGNTRAKIAYEFSLDLEQVAGAFTYAVMHRIYRHKPRNNTYAHMQGLRKLARENDKWQSLKDFIFDPNQNLYSPPGREWLSPPSAKEVEELFELQGLDEFKEVKKIADLGTPGSLSGGGPSEGATRRSGKAMGHKQAKRHFFGDG